MPKYIDLEYELYKQMCVGCHSERRCHNECEHCEEFDNELEEIYKISEEEEEK